MAGLEEVKEYWDSRSPGLLHSEHEAGTAEFFADIERARYDDEFKYRYLPKVAEFDRHSGKQVLEVGVGLGTDLLQFAKNGSNVHGIDLTSGAIDLTRRRFELTGLDEKDVAKFTERERLLWHAYRTAKETSERVDAQVEAEKEKRSTAQPPAKGTEAIISAVLRPSLSESAPPSSAPIMQPMLTSEPNRSPVSDSLHSP